MEERGSFEAFLEHHQQAKKGPRRKRKTDAILKRRVWALREKHYQCCGQKIQYFLRKRVWHASERYDNLQDTFREVSIALEVAHLSPSAVHTGLRGGQCQGKNKPRGPLPVAQAARQVLQMDTVLFGEVFAFTAVDIYTRESDVLLRAALEATDGKAFLKHCMPRRFDGFTEVIQTDGGSEFKGEFSETVDDYCERHRVARPYKKNEQSYIEGFNRNLRKECLGWSKYPVSEIPTLTLWVEEWLRYYHYERPHISLGMRPPLDTQV